MNSIRVFGAALLVLSGSKLAAGNPIPPPVEEWLDVRIEPSTGTLRARVDGDFGFLPTMDFPTTMSFPVPPQSTIVGIWQETDPLAWEWIPDRYSTVLPEMPTIPMLQWTVLAPLPIYHVTFHAIYEHDLIRRPGEYIFFYALGSGRYMTGTGIQHGLAAWINVHLLPGTHVYGVWLNQHPHEFAVCGDTLEITVFSLNEPETRDLMVSLAPSEMRHVSGWFLR